ncbi:uncharacterized protein LOC126562019 [Anopheles maculipalpis]|uniref:uncharacterized protein LOC126562019 n=1 Tax=Anopheles maculipalpis TaxID=1496333 RepID=UPI0021592326|nr:uncharacterized protein LOC126562019 [Anopheles maculipalpis]
MSFLRTFRPNLILSTAPPSPHGGTERGTMRTGTPSSKSATAPAKPASSGSRKNSTSTSRTITEEPDRASFINNGRRSSSNSVGTVQNRSGSKQQQQHGGSSSGRYGKENPAPIVVYLDKQPDGKKRPTSILRTNTFTRHDDEVPERVRQAVTRSETFTINETNDEPTINTGTYTRPAKILAPATTDVFEPLYAKNISLSSQEQLPVVVDSRTYRKKSFKTSKPVQKVESFIKRFERTLFSKGTGNDSKRHGSSRKGSNASEVTIVPAPRFRDVGINCKLDEEEKFKAKLEAMKQSRQSSRDSLINHRERSLSPGKQRYFTSGTYDRRSSSSLSVQPLKEDGNSYTSGRESTTPPLQMTSSPGNRSTLYKPTESSFLKSRQKEIEMGYSVVNKRQPGFYLSGGRDALEERPVSNSRERHYSNHQDKSSRRDTYQTLKDEYERQQAHAATKPVGIASPRMSAIRTSTVDVPQSPLAIRKDSQPDLPKYTFGTTDLQQRRSRFQQFQKSFKRMDDSASEVSVQQSFFVPI